MTIITKQIDHVTRDRVALWFGIIIIIIIIINLGLRVPQCVYILQLHLSVPTS